MGLAAWQDTGKKSTRNIQSWKWLCNRGMYKENITLIYFLNMWQAFGHISELFVALLS